MSGVISREFDAVFLDVGGVFHLPAHELILAALAGAGFEADPARLDRAHYVGIAALVEWPEVERGIWERYQSAYCAEVGVPGELVEASVAALDVAFTTEGIWKRRVPGSVEGLWALHGTGVTLAVVSNADGTVERRLREEGICQVGPGAGVPVTVVVDSAVVGSAKPDPEIFRHACEATGVPPERAVHVGDTVGADVAGALAAGITPLHLDPYGLCGDRSHGHLGSLVELAHRLRR